MRKPVMTGLAASTLVAPIAFLLVAIPSTPATAIEAGEAAAKCKQSKNCVGTWAPNGGWTGILLTPNPDNPITVTCPPKKDCFLERKGGRRPAQAGDILKPPAAGQKPPSVGQF